MDINKKTYKSHILLVRQLVRPYQIKTTDGKQVKYLDLKTESIQQIKVKDIDSEEKYFDEIMEDFLDKNIESPFAETISKLERMLNNNSTKGLTIKDLDIIRRFFQFSLLRNKEMFKKIVNDATFASLLQGFNPSVMLAFSHSTDEYFKNKRITIIRNLTSNGYNFVCPHNVVYYFKNSFYKEFDLAISVNQKIIVCLNIKQESNHVDILELEDDSDIRTLNCAAYLVEKNHGLKYVVGKEDDLKRLIEDIQEIELKNKDIIVVDIKK